MYKIISKQFKHILIGNLPTKEKAEEEVKYITEQCSLYKLDEIEIIYVEEKLHKPKKGLEEYV